MRPYKYFDLDENEVDAPLILREFIPDGYCQSWDEEEHRYILEPLGRIAGEIVRQRMRKNAGRKRKIRVLIKDV